MKGCSRKHDWWQMDGISSTYNTWILWLIIFLYLLFSYCSILRKIMASISEKDYGMKKTLPRNKTQSLDNFDWRENHGTRAMMKVFVHCIIMVCFYNWDCEYLLLFSFSIVPHCSFTFYYTVPASEKKNTNSFWLGWMNIQACEQILYLLIKSS